MFDKMLGYIFHCCAQNYRVSSSHIHVYDLLYSYFMPVWRIVKTAAPRCRGQLDALLPEAKRPRAMVYRAVHVTEGQ